MPTSPVSPRTRPSTLSLSTWAVILPLVTLAFLGVISIPSANERGAAVLANFSEAVSRILLEPLGISAAPPLRGVSATSINSTAAASFLDTVKARRTWYALDKSLPISPEDITRIVEDAIQAVPSAFNSQSNRAVVLFDAEHDKLWDIVTEVLKARVSEDQWLATGDKMAGFRAAAGTVCYAA